MKVLTGHNGSPVLTMDPLHEQDRLRKIITLANIGKSSATEVVDYISHAVVLKINLQR